MPMVIMVVVGYENSLYPGIWNNYVILYDKQRLHLQSKISDKRIDYIMVRSKIKFWSISIWKFYGNIDI